MRYLIALVTYLSFGLVYAQNNTGPCQLISTTCVEPAATRMIQGYPVTRDCWRYASQYKCRSSNIDDCGSYRDRGCTPISTQCIQYDGPTCILQTITYECEIEPARTVIETDCGNQMFCADGNCFDNSHPPDRDFGRAMAGLESMRQAGFYNNCVDTGTKCIFKGFDNRCKKKLFGLIDCCRKNGGLTLPLSTAQLISSASSLTGSVTGVGSMGSNYTFDSLFANDDSNLAELGFSNLTSTIGQSLSSLVGGDLSVANIMNTFSPSAWAESLVMAQINSLISCSEPEKNLVIKREQKLCSSVGSYCSQSIPILKVCIEKTNTFCCFNSKLGRIINEQGLGQLGQSFGSPQNPMCGGFSIDEIQRLDFSRINLDEFTQDIVYDQPNLPDMKNRLQQQIQGCNGGRC